MSHATIRLRPGRATRPVAALLAGVLFALSVAAGFHRGDHDDLGWLPSRFHHHDFELRAPAAGAPLPLVDHCLACHVSRTLVRLAGSQAASLVAPATIAAGAPSSADLEADRADFPRTPRAPPA